MVKKFERSPLTERLVKYLAAFDKGAQISYVELSRITGEKINSRTANLTYARKLLQDEHRHVWIAVKNEGIKRLNDREIAERLPNWHLRGARGKLKRGGSQAGVVDLKQLDINEQARFGVNVLQQQLASNALSRQSHNKLAKVSRGTANDLPSFNILEWALPLSTPPRKK
jgi:hypothetical protein